MLVSKYYWAENTKFVKEKWGNFENNVFRPSWIFSITDAGWSCRLESKFSWLFIVAESEEGETYKLPFPVLVTHSSRCSVKNN